MMTRLAYTLGSLLIAAACGGSQHSTTTGAAAPTADFVEAAPRVHIDGALVAAPEAKKHIEPLDAVTFAHDQSQLDAISADQIDTAARWLKDHPQHNLVLEGHADATGMEVYNEDLASRRMDAVRQRMLQHGIASQRIMMINFGDREAMDEHDPLAGADRKVVLYATQLSPQAVAAMVRVNRPAITATWVDSRGALMQLTNGLETPIRREPAQTARR